MLVSSHRNDGDIVAARDPDDGTRRRSAPQGLPQARHGLRDLCGLILRPGRDGTALETRYVSAGAVGRIGVGRTIGDGEQQLTLLRRIGARGDLDVACGDCALELS